MTGQGARDRKSRWAFEELPRTTERRVDAERPSVRGGQGVRGIKLTARKGYVVAAFMVGIDDDIFVIATGGVVSGQNSWVP